MESEKKSKIERLSMENVELGDLLVVSHSNFISVFPVIEVTTEGMIIKDGLKIPVEYDSNIVLKKNGTYLIGKDIKCYNGLFE